MTAFWVVLAIVGATAFAASLAFAPAVLIWGELADRRAARWERRQHSSQRGQQSQHKDADS